MGNHGLLLPCDDGYELPPEQAAVLNCEAELRRRRAERDAALLRDSEASGWGARRLGKRWGINQSAVKGCIDRAALDRLGNAGAGADTEV